MMVWLMALDIETEAMVAGLITRAEEAAAETLNILAEQVYRESQLEVPKSEDHQARTDPNYPEQPLSETGEIRPAAPDDLAVQVLYNSPYAAAQHEGHMTYESRSGKTVDWEVEQYTTQGTKKKYLEDPGKAAIAQGPEELALQGHIAFGEIRVP